MLAKRIMATTNAKRALVVGLGLSGLSSARWLAGRGYRVTVVDSRAQPLQRPRPSQEKKSRLLPFKTMVT